MRELQKQTENLRTGVDERQSQWVPFHNGYTYLLPIVSRFDKIVPTFADDGSVSLQMEVRDPEVEALVNHFINLIATVDAGVIWFSTQEAYEQFFRLVRKLIVTNYDLTSEQLVALLTVNNEQMNVLFNSMFRHIMR